MRLFLLLTSLILATSNIFGQPWTQNLPKNKTSKELTFFDYQKAFNEYWSNYNLDRGFIVDDTGNKRKASGWKQFKRWEYYMESIIDHKTGAFPKKNATNIYCEWQKKNTEKGGKWTVIGPSSSSGGYAGIGRINIIAFHPTNTDQYWVGAASGGVWETTNNGSTWECLTDNNPVLGISDILVSYDFETSNTLYIATGDRDSWDTRSVGVLKSTNAGQTWETTGLSYTLADGEMVTRLLQDPNNAQIILAATTTGLYKTTDGASTWEKLTTDSFIDMEYKPGDFNTIYGSKTNGKSYVSTDGGATFTQGLYSMGGQRVELAVTPANSDIVYAISCLSNGGLRGIYRSNDSGVTFTELVNGTNSGKNYLGWSNGNDSGGQGSYDLSIAASPEDEGIVLIGGINTWRSIDGGTTWNMETHWYGGYSTQAVHADKHFLKFRSNGDLFEGNDGGVYISTNNGHSGSWNDKTNGMEISQIYRLGTSATDADEVIIGLQDNGSKLTWSGFWVDVKGGDGMECLIDYTNKNIQYGTSYYGAISRTTNHWGSDTDVTPSSAGNGAWVTPFVMSSEDNSTIYGGFSNVWKTTNKGSSWTKISTMNSSGKLRSLAVATSDPNTILAADLYSIWKTNDGGSTWSIISQELPYNGITYITIKHNDPNTIWATFAGYNSNAIFETTDGGSSWTNISGNLPEIPASCVVENKQYEDGEMLFIGTELGVFMKIDDEDWVAFNNDLPNVKIGELEIYYDEENPTNTRLKAATYGRGLWETPITMGSDILFHITHGTSGSDIENAEITIAEETITTNSSGEATINLPNGTYNYSVSANGYEPIANEQLTVEGPATINVIMSNVGISELIHTIKIYPNPTKNKINIDLDNDFKATIISESGQILFSGTFSNQATIDVNEFSSGIYFLELNIEGEKVTQKIIIE